jgi:sulfiredoxin
LIMMKREIIPIADIYVPIKRRATLDQKRVDEIAASILDKGLQAPILVRADGSRFVLVEGLHRLEAAKALGKELSPASLSMRESTELLLTCRRAFVDWFLDEAVRGLLGEPRPLRYAIAFALRRARKVVGERAIRRGRSHS